LFGRNGDRHGTGNGTGTGTIKSGKVLYRLEHEKSEYIVSVHNTSNNMKYPTETLE